MLKMDIRGRIGIILMLSFDQQKVRRAAGTPMFELLMRRQLLFWIALILGSAGIVRGEESAGESVSPKTYLAELEALLRVDWPRNRTVNIVCHGHSVPAGYFETPEVRSLEAYPALLRNDF